MELAGSLKNAELQIISGTGHEINIEAPEKLSEVLRDKPAILLSEKKFDSIKTIRFDSKFLHI